MTLTEQKSNSKSQITETENGFMRFISDEPFEFQFGGSIPALELMFETHGELNSDKSNAILIHHALSPSCHIASHEKNTAAGWWEEMIGPGKPIDTNHYFVICINNLGSPFGSSSPASINPATGNKFQSDFPTFTLDDIVRSQKLLLDYLGIEKLHCVIGNSMGGMLSLSFAIQFPDSVKHAIFISSSYKAYPANIANRVIQKDIIRLDPEWQQGKYTNNPINGLKTARKLGHFTYRNAAGLNDKFATNHKDSPEQISDVESYLEYNANKFAQNYDANCYLYILGAMDLFDLTRGDANAFNKITADVLVISVDSDILFTPPQQQDLYQQLKTSGVTVDYIDHHSSYGHDAFLVEVDAFGQYIRSILERS